MASPFTTVSKDAILAEDEASVLTNTKKETKVCLTDGLQVGKKKTFSLGLQENYNYNPPNTLN